jgi:hypothetical protein
VSLAVQLRRVAAVVSSCNQQQQPRLQAVQLVRKLENVDSMQCSFRNFKMTLLFYALFKRPHCFSAVHEDVHEDHK